MEEILAQDKKLDKQLEKYQKEYMDLMTKLITVELKIHKLSEKIYGTYRDSCSTAYNRARASWNSPTL